jgi:hypothetical protein
VKSLRRLGWKGNDERASCKISGELEAKTGKNIFPFYRLQSIQINDSEKNKPKGFDPTAGKWT